MSTLITSRKTYPDCSTNKPLVVLSDWRTFAGLLGGRKRLSMMTWSGPQSFISCGSGSWIWRACLWGRCSTLWTIFHPILFGHRWCVHLPSKCLPRSCIWVAAEGRSSYMEWLRVNWRMTMESCQGNCRSNCVFLYLDRAGVHWQAGYKHSPQLPSNCGRISVVV
jgi:hypothetical protein